MKKTKLVKILSSFNASEIRKLTEFVYSPYFNKNKKIQALLTYLIKFYPDFESPDLTKENAFVIVFEEEEYKEQAITKIISKLYKLIFQFIHIEMDKENNIHADIAILRFLSQRELIQEYSRHLKQMKKGIDRTTMQDSDFFYQQFLVEQELSKLQRAKPDPEIGKVDYQSAVDALDKFYLVLKLIYLCQQLNHQQTSHLSDYQYELLQELENYIPSSPYFEIPAIRIWFTALLLLKSKEKEPYYFELKRLVFEHFKKLNNFDIKNLFSLIQNNARYIIKNKMTYYSELFDIYNFQLERGIFKHPMVLTPQIFLNIITVALLLEKLAWAEKFLNEHEDYSLNRQDDVNNLCWAMVAFERKDYSKAQDHLNLCKLKNIYMKLGERRMRLKVYFELRYHELIEDSVNSYRKFLSTNKSGIAKLHLEANRNFVNLVNQIFNLAKPDHEKLMHLDIEIQKTPALPDRRWLLEKINDIKK